MQAMLKIRHQAVAGAAEHAAAMTLDERLEHLAKLAEGLRRGLLVGPHQPRITGHIGTEDGHQLALGPGLLKQRR